MRLSRLFDVRWLAPVGAMALLIGLAAPAQAGPLTPFPPGGNYDGETLRYRPSFFDVFIELPEFTYNVTNETAGDLDGDTLSDDVDYTVDIFLHGTVCVSSGGCDPFAHAEGTAVVRARGTDADHFDTEMVSMSLAATTLFGPVMIRESPSRPSMGQTLRLNGLPPGVPYIDSFFDVFTELSIDGGQTWHQSLADDMQSPQSDRFMLEGGVPDVPEPATLMLVGTGIAALIRRRTRRH